MRNHVIKGLAFSLAILMLFSVVACSAPEPGQEASTQTPTEAVTEVDTEYKPDIDVTNYDCDFVVGGVDLIQENVYVEKMEGDPLSDAIYERMVNIKDHLGVTIKSQGIIDAFDVSAVILRNVMSGADDYQMVATHPYIGIPETINQNCAYDLGELEAVNLDAPYWATEFMEDIKIEDHYYIGYNDFCLSLVMMIVFNKDMMQDYRMTAPYQTVVDHKWTLDMLMSMASTVAEDNGDNVWDDKDTYGLTGSCWVPMISMISACGLKMVDKDDTGEFEVVLGKNPDKLYDFMQKIDRLYNGGYSYLWNSDSAKPNRVQFANGTSLFQLLYSTELITFRGESIPFGVLPYPKYEEKQENYQSLSWNGLFFVPSSIKNPDMVGEVLELLCYYNKPVQTAFYEDLLGTKIANAPEDALMLDYIWDSQVTDVCVMTATAGGGLHDLLYFLPQLCTNGTIDKFTSKLTGLTRSSNKALEKLFSQ